MILADKIIDKALALVDMGDIKHSIITEWLGNNSITVQSYIMPDYLIHAFSNDLIELYSKSDGLIEYCKLRDLLYSFKVLPHCDGYEIKVEYSSHTVKLCFMPILNIILFLDTMARRRIFSTDYVKYLDTMNNFEHYIGHLTQKRKGSFL